MVKKLLKTISENFFVAFILSIVSVIFIYSAVELSKCTPIDGGVSDIILKNTIGKAKAFNVSFSTLYDFRSFDLFGLLLLFMIIVFLAEDFKKTRIEENLKKENNKTALILNMVLSVLLVLYSALFAPVSFGNGIIAGIMLFLVIINVRTILRRNFQISSVLCEVVFLISLLLYFIFGLLGILNGYNFMYNFLINPSSFKNVFSSGISFYVNILISIIVSSGMSYMYFLHEK